MGSMLNDSRRFSRRFLYGGNHVAEDFGTEEIKQQGGGLYRHSLERFSRRSLHVTIHCSKNSTYRKRCDEDIYQFPVWSVSPAGVKEGGNFSRVSNIKKIPAYRNRCDCAIYRSQYRVHQRYQIHRLGMYVQSTKLLS